MAEVTDDLTKFGFQRPEMYQTNLAGSVDPYDRHIFLCYKTYQSWPPRIETSDSDLLPKLLYGAFKARRKDILVQTRITICQGLEGTEFLDGDVLIFPEMIKYRGLEESNVDSFVEDVLVNGKPWTFGVQSVLTGSHVFVCAHTSRDKRCGVCGPALIEKFNEEIEFRTLKDQVFVSACSHVGGHKYAGNLIIFSPDSEGKITGHWYGYVAPSDVADLLDSHIAKGVVIERLLRGQMGVHVEEAKKEDGEVNSNGKELNGQHEKKKKKEKKKDQEEIIEEKENVSSCCQVSSNGISCCRDEEKKEIENEKKKSFCNLSSCWTEKWEKSDVLATMAVFGAVATVAVAYSLYRRRSA
ncbi:altered inheritance of mitochondria protein 32 [Impatiens glandulifera]|uniref:altered inheritance of mitochondria protein 32 n=1 Tax=Impatiens glandulifera TaxID=253017 RepID=UPI001FB053B4|nr:altered inheritance of mitochondria protein 32 [Impatiens glandulifera]